MRHWLVTSILIVAGLGFVAGVGAAPGDMDPAVELVNTHCDRAADTTLFTYRVVAGQTGIVSWQLISCADESAVLEASEPVSVGRDAAGRSVLVFTAPYDAGESRTVDILLQGCWAEGPATAGIEGEERISVTLTGPLGHNCHILTMQLRGEGHVFPGTSSFRSGTEVLIVARAVPGWRFVHWEGADDNTPAVTTVTMTGPRTVTAVFEPEARDEDELELSPVRPGDASEDRELPATR